MAALINSPSFGVAKRAELVIVKTLQDKMTDQIDAFSKVHHDILEKSVSRPVINYSRNPVSNADGSAISDDDLRELYIAIKSLLDDGAVLFVSAGNHAINQQVCLIMERLDSILTIVMQTRQPDQPNINSYPALFAFENRFGKPLPIIVVGSAFPSGELADFSQQGDRLGVYTVGYDISCPLGSGSTGVTHERGTSGCKPMISSSFHSHAPTLDKVIDCLYLASAISAGLAAYLWSIEEYRVQIEGDANDKAGIATRMQALIQQLAWTRQEITDPEEMPIRVPMIANGKQSEEDPASDCDSDGSSGQRKRQDGSSASVCTLSASPSTSPTSGPTQTPISTPPSSTSTTAPPSSSSPPSTTPSSTASSTSTSSSSTSSTALPTSSGWALTIYDAACDKQGGTDYDYVSSSHQARFTFDFRC